MNIAINCWVLRNKKYDGIGYFTIYTVKQLIKTHKETNFIILVDTNFKEQFFNYPNAKIIKVFPPFRHPLLYIFFLEFVIPFVLIFMKADLFLSPDGMLSLLSRKKQVPIIHDLNFEHFPKNIDFKNRIYYKYFFKKFANKATRIITISEYSKKDIETLYKIPSNCIDIVYCGISKEFRPLSEEEIKFTRVKYSNGEPYFFFIGSIHPRKNIERLILAFDKFKTETTNKVKLIIAGSTLWDNSQLIDVHKNCKFHNDIIFTGRVGEAELTRLLGSSYGLSFVPIFEGFGIPIIEAFQVKVPVMTSNVTSLPEVAGDAAVYVNPFDIDSIKDGFRVLYDNHNKIIEKLVEKGNKQKEKFSWDKTAALVWNSIQKAINPKGL
jgi:glycosyltransferase involved in cell wall biosynthesis